MRVFARANEPAASVLFSLQPLCASGVLKGNAVTIPSALDVSMPTEDTPAPTRTQAEAFYLGTWRVEPQRNLLQTGQGAVRIEPRVMDLLVFLAGRANQVVSMPPNRLMETTFTIHG